MSTITMEINYHYCRLHTAVCPPALRWSVGCNTDWSSLSLSLSKERDANHRTHKKGEGGTKQSMHTKRVCVGGGGGGGGGPSATVATRAPFRARR